METIEKAAQVAGWLSAILGIVSAMLVNPIRKARKRRLEEKEEQAKYRKMVLEKLEKIEKDMNDRLGDVCDDIGDLQYERLSQAYDFYVAQGWCPDSKKEMLCQMHKSYRKKGRNHLSEHYEEEILRLKSKPEQMT